MDLLVPVVFALLGACLVFLIIFMLMRRGQKSNMDEFCAAHGMRFTPEPLWSFVEAAVYNYSSKVLGCSAKIFAKKAPLSWQEAKIKTGRSLKDGHNKIIAQSEQTVEVQGISWQTIVYRVKWSGHIFDRTFAYYLSGDGHISFALDALVKDDGLLQNEVERLPVYLSCFSAVSS